jgi:hypothetical protein
MKVFQLRFALLAVAALLALGAAVSTINAVPLVGHDGPTVAHAQEAQDDGDGGIDVVPGVVWTVVGVVAGAVVMGALYFLKRRLGGFPENPSWVAPISIETSDTFHDEGTFGDQVPSAQAHAEH